MFEAALRDEVVGGGLQPQHLPVKGNFPGLPRPRHPPDTTPRGGSGRSGGAQSSRVRLGGWFIQRFMTGELGRSDRTGGWGRNSEHHGSR
jgi:hypothetical protein